MTKAEPGAVAHHLGRQPRRTSELAPEVSSCVGREKRRRPHLLVIALILLLVVLTLRVWVVEPVMVSSDSMEPTIASGAVVLLYKPHARADSIRNGVVIAFSNPVDGRTAIKRVIAGEGQTVAIRDSLLYVDDVAVPEPFIDHSRIDATYFGPVTVPTGTVFVLGDNRGVSIDSRDFGAVPLQAVSGTLLTGRKHAHGECRVPIHDVPERFLKTPIIYIMSGSGKSGPSSRHSFPY